MKMPHLKPSSFRCGRDFVVLVLVVAALAPAGCKAKKFKLKATTAEVEPSPAAAGQLPSQALGDATINTANGAFLVGAKPMVRVAVIGDQGLGPRSIAVLDLIRDAAADFLVVVGDYDYDDKPQAWADQMNQLGDDYPWFAVLGNHDTNQWPQYERLITAHQAGIASAHCTGKPGLQASCVYRGVQLVMSEIGSLGNRADDEAFIKGELDKSRSLWKLCLWHKTQHDMQVGAKKDEVGWAAYQACQAAGAIVVTGHEHSYSRTRTLTAIGDAVHGHGAVGSLNRVEVGPGRTFVAVSGLGGKTTRKFDTAHIADSWWGAYFTADRQIVNGDVMREDREKDGVGALFLDLGAEGDIKRGRGRFVTAFDRRVVDDFSIQFQ